MTMDSPYTLPHDFLSGPAHEIKKEVIDFKKTDLPEYNGLYACVLDNVLTGDECSQLVEAAEARTNGKWEQAMINVGNNKQMLDTSYRSCGRIIWDDRDVVAKIWARMQDQVPEILDWKLKARVSRTGLKVPERIYKFTRLNERMRFLSYVEGNYFRPHFDGSYATEDDEEISFITLHLYLNEPSQESQLEGGSTRFHALDWSDRFFDIMPKIGRVLIFQHAGLLHSGADVISGVKFTMRTDIMFKKAV